MSNQNLVVIDPETGELVEQQVHIFDNGGRGEVPEFKKVDLAGQTVLITGITAEPEEFPLGPVRFIQLYREGDDTKGEAWGVMFHADSPVVKQVEHMVQRGKVPFLATLSSVKSQEHKGQTYWKLSKPEPRQVNGK